MMHFFEERDPWGKGLAVWVVVVLLFLAPLAWWGVRQTRLEDDVESWLAPDDPQVQVRDWMREQFPAEETIYLTWKGSALNDPRVEKLAQRLQGTRDAEGVRRNGLRQVQSVTVPTEALAAMERAGVEPNEAVRRLQGVLIGNGTLKVRLTETGRGRRREIVEQLTKSAKEQLGLEIKTDEPLADLAAVQVPLFAAGDAETTESDSDPAAVPTESATENAAEAVELLPPAILSATGKLVPDGFAEHDLQVSWHGLRIGTDPVRRFCELAANLRLPSRSDEPLIDATFFVPGSPVALAVVLSDEGLADTADTCRAIRQVATEVGIPPESLHLGGRAVAAAELNKAVAQAAWNPSAPWWQLPRRSVVLLSVVVGAALAFLMLPNLRVTALVLLVALYATFVSVALVPVSGGDMDMVLVVLPSLLMLLTLSGAIPVIQEWRRAAANDPATAVIQACRAAWQPCLVASVATAISLATLMTSSVLPMREFGLYATIGTIISFVMVLYGLPALLQLWPGRVRRVEEIDPQGWKWLGRVLTKSGWITAAVCLAVGLTASYGLRFVRTETKIIRYLPDSADVVRSSQQIEDNIAGLLPVELIVRFDEQSQSENNFLDRLETVRAIAEQMRSHAEITGAVSLADYEPVVERPDADAPFLIRGRYNKQAAAAEQQMREDSAGHIKHFYTVARTDHHLPAPSDRTLSKAGDELWRITARAVVMADVDYGALTTDLDRIAQSVLKYHPGATHVVAGGVPLSLRTQQAVLASFLASFGLVVALAAAAMIVLLRNPLGGFVALLSNLLSITAVFGLLGWFGQRVDIGTLLTASIAVGIAVNGTLRLLRSFQRELREGRSRTQAIVDALGHCGPALWQTSLIVGVGLLMLTPADLLPISRFGWMMAALTGAAFLGNVVFLPALLATPLGRLFEQPQASEPTATPEPPNGPPRPHLWITTPRTERIANDE